RPFAERSPGHLAHQGKALGEERIEGLAAPSPLPQGLRPLAQLPVGELVHLRLEVVDDVEPRQVRHELLVRGLLTGLPPPTLAHHTLLADRKLCNPTVLSSPE